MMKATGILRMIDQLGRIVVPKELRDSFNIEEKDKLEIFVTDEGILLKKYSPGCQYCSNMENLTDYKGKLICSECIKSIAELAS